MQDQKEKVREALNALFPVVKSNPHEAMCMAIGFFIIIYSQLDFQNKLSSVKTLRMLAGEIGAEQFEDYQDYVDFMRQFMD